MKDETQIIHATSVLHAGTAALIIGPSGSGKSGLALQMMALGAGLIADDRVILNGACDLLMASCPPALKGLIEARGVGIVNAAPAPPTPVSLVVDMGRVETERMPPLRNVTYLGHILPLLWHVDSPHFPATLMQILSHGRSTR